MAFSELPNRTRCGGLRFGPAASRRFCLSLKNIDFHHPFSEERHDKCRVSLLGCRGRSRCSGKVNFSSAKVSTRGENACAAQKRRRSARWAGDHRGSTLPLPLHFAACRKQSRLFAGPRPAVKQSNWNRVPLARSIFIIPVPHPGPSSG